MYTIIDGYNVLHCGGFLDSNVGPGRLRKARGTLVGLLAKYMSAQERNDTIVVFDAKTKVGTANCYRTASGVQVQFASNHDQADDLIEELIRRHSVPKQLTVVSSDRRLKLAAKRRGARSLDSDTWIEHLTSTQIEEPVPVPVSPRDRTLDPDQVQEWLAVMNLTDMAEGEDTVGDKDFSPEAQVNHPFPPGYADELLEEDDLLNEPDDRPE